MAFSSSFPFSSGEASGPSFISSNLRQLKDLPFTILFMCNILLILSFSITYGIHALLFKPVHVIVIDSSGDTTHDTPTSYTHRFIFGIFFLVIISSILSILWVYITSTMATKIVIFSLSTVILVNVFGGVGLFASGKIFGGLILLMIALFSFLFFLYVRARIEFVAANLKVACKAVLSMPSIFTWSLVILFIQIVWCVLWTIAAFGVATNESIWTIEKGSHTYDLRSCTTYNYQYEFHYGDTTSVCNSSHGCSLCVCSGTIVSHSSCFTPKINYWKYFALIVSLYWTCCVLSNIVHVATAHSISHWWFYGLPDAGGMLRGTSQASSWKIVQNSMIHSSTRLLGPIAFGSLVVAIIRSLRSLVYLLVTMMGSGSGLGGMGVKFTPPSISIGGRVHTPNMSRQAEETPQNKLKRFVVECLLVMLSILDRAVTYFNHYAFCYVAIREMSFIEASRSVVQLFSSKGFTTLINDNLLDNILTLGHVVVGVLTMFLAYFYCLLVDMGPHSVETFMLTCGGFATGYLMCMLTLNIVSSATSTVYVCFAENSLSLQTHHPEHYEYLLSKWRKFYPESMISSGTKGDQPYVPPNLPSSSQKNPVKSSSKKFQQNTYSSLPVAEDDETPPSPYGGESDEEESIQLNNLPLSLSQIMSISKNTMNSAVNIAIQGKNSLNEFIASNTSQSDSQNPRVNRGTYGKTSSSNENSASRHTISDDTLENSML